TQTSRCHRDYAIRLLRGDYTYTTQPIRHPCARYYTAEDAAALEHLCELLDGMCSNLLKAEIPLVLDGLRQDGTLVISDTCAQHLLEMSPATMDRLRRRRRPQGKHRHGFTKPGTLVKYRIPARTFAERNPNVPGHLDVDLVDHSGENARGEFAYTLDEADAFSQWIEPRALLTQAQEFVLEELQSARLDLPFTLLGIHSDSDSEFTLAPHTSAGVNDQLYRYCKAELLKFTRGRAGKKNDKPRVEQKNRSVVRHLVSYGRYETPKQVDQLDAVYSVARQYVNFFKPVMKLKAKRRVGSKVKKIYDDPKTPYQRLLESPTLSPAEKAKLKAIYAGLSLSKVKTELDRRLAGLKPSRSFTDIHS
ncbi:MAG: hypothetical protein M1132_04135, partial [Chloroflexi bacterium]|nr:hypothetical protein [Chloroflexota bacterium]